MTQERLAKIRHLIDEALGPRELAGLRWGLGQQGELTSEVLAHFDETLKRRGWALPEYGR